jgi:hypothetical protein
MNPYRLAFFFGIGLILIGCSASAQVSITRSTAPLNNATEKKSSEAKAEADQIREAHRANARLLLISLGSEAYGFHDQALRARSLARIADILWDVDHEQGRALFRKAWEAAEAGDQESHEPLKLGESPVNLRREVLTLLAKRDRLLAEEFLQKTQDDQQKTGVESSGTNLWELSEASQKRLSLAVNLLKMGDINSALQFADPVLSGVTISTIEFLTLLREKDPVAADKRYASMLDSSSRNISADANTVSLLSSYIFTPHMYVTFDASGGANVSWSPSPFQSPNVAPQLRLAFFQTASGILLRPQPPAEQDQSTTGIAGKYMVLKRLLPLFEQYAPKEILTAMHGQLEALDSLVNDSVRQSEDEWIQKGISPEKQLATDQEHSLLDQIEHAGTSDVRGDLYFKLALLALSKGDLKARDYVNKIDESGFRKQAQAWVDWGLSLGAVEKKKIETALDLARSGELSHIQRVWVLTQTAKLLAKTDRAKALSLLDDATAEVQRIEVADPDRPRGFLAIANALELIKPSRAWETAFDAVKAANSADGFTGQDGVLTLGVSSKSLISNKRDAVADFDVNGIFGKLADDDYDHAIQLARGFQDEAPRINATIAIARAVLIEKHSPLPITRRLGSKNN